MENEAHNMSAHRNTFKIKNFSFYSDVECPLTRDNSDKIQKNHMTIQHHFGDCLTDLLAVIIAICSSFLIWLGMNL